MPDFQFFDVYETESSLGLVEAELLIGPKAARADTWTGRASDIGDGKAAENT